jgi:putative FmdB family regulatory protein
MPLYEYKCQSCGRVFEVIQKFSDQPLKVHADCGGALERLLSPSVFQFKGTGWYVTDYARAGRDKKDGDAQAPKPEVPPAKTESKPSTSTADK